SFFTPGFITMYMCRETIRRAVVQKFNEAKSWACGDIIDLYNKIEDRTEANNIINSIKICDPAVGSGHFLVSALNEMIAIKSDLHILQDKNGRLLRGYRVEVINDELSIRDEEGYLYAYNPRNAESQRIQETLFHEKETIIESCLFGVDINPNSVKICRLRLWIELLKNAYYKAPNILETLPNIDINIKCGNSLISRFALDVDMSEVFKKKETTVQKYLLAVQAYKDTNDKDAKAETKAFIDKLKAEFTTTLYARDPKKVEMSKLRGRISLIDNAAEIGDLFGKLDDVNIIKDREKLQKQLDKLEAEVAEQQSGKFFDDANAFEWRFEFPEVLNDEGDFVGFDVVIGNPPYGAELYDSIKVFLKEKYTLYHTRWTDTFNYFIGHGIDISKDSANVCLIIPNNFLFQTEYEKSRRKVIEQHKIIKVINLGDGIFLDAEVPTCIILFSKNNHINNLVKYTDLRRENKNENIFLNANYVNSYRDEILSSSSVSFSIDKIGTTIIKRNIDSIITIDTIAEEVANGIQPTGDKIFRLSPDKVVDLGIEPAILKKVLTGSDFHKYVINETNYKIIYTNKDVDITKYPKCLSYLNQFKEQLSKKRETLKGTLPWWSLHWPRYSGLFEEEKIIFRQTSDTIICSYDNDGYYVMNTVLVLKVKQEYKKLLPYKYLLGILNSRLINYFYKQITQEENRVFAEVKPINIRKLPILKASYHQQQQLISLVDLILSSKKHNNLLDTTDLETQIDQLVYELYGLTEGEIRIVEGNG
ncbi:MAG TPA: TaqI-like C-terminal specificity domain-containing protein, partial [Saprospiraceae bacterium]|nr:TaqI-like C-terminal specificity domain-containing protein [Saprospiraceae bacterium]